MGVEILDLGAHGLFEIRNFMNGAIGFGLGLRPQHYQEILDGAGGADWFEIISENYMAGGGRPLANLLAVRERYPVAMHGVSLSIGSADPLDPDYLNQLRDLASLLEPTFVSDHLCWTGIAGINTHDLLPLVHNEKTLNHVRVRIEQVQDALGRPFVLENASTYVGFLESTIPEWEFLMEIARQSGCKILFDVNNVYVNSINHGFDAGTFIDFIPRDLIAYVHLAGHENNGTHIIDTHDHPIADPVWQLYARLISRIGVVPTMIERDDRIPPFSELTAELQRARSIAAACSLGTEISAA